MNCYCVSIHRSSAEVLIMRCKAFQAVTSHGIELEFNEWLGSHPETEIVHTKFAMGVGHIVTEYALLVFYRTKTAERTRSDP